MDEADQRAGFDMSVVGEDRKPQTKANDRKWAPCTTRIMRKVVPFGLGRVTLGQQSNAGVRMKRRQLIMAFGGCMAWASAGSIVATAQIRKRHRVGFLAPGGFAPDT